jgi:membrane associated rhomboid family serine protease
MPYLNERPDTGRLQMFPPVIRALLLINALVFLLGMMQSAQVQEILAYCALWPVSVSEAFRPWQFVTYLFLHAGLGHIFLNMLALWMFGMELENLWGSKRFLIYYLACGIGAGVMQSIVMAVTGSTSPTVGASGAIMGVMTAFGLIFPDRIIYFNFFFPMKAKWAVLIFAGIDLFSGISSSPGDNVAHFAHLGGALVGFIILRAGGKLTLGGVFDRRRGAPPRVVPPPPRERARVVDVQFRESEPAPSSRHAPAQMNFGSDQERIDAILDKISRTGYQTLTDEEKAILTEASKRMR